MKNFVLFMAFILFFGGCDNLSNKDDFGSTTTVVTANGVSITVSTKLGAIDHIRNWDEVVSYFASTSLLALFSPKDEYIDEFTRTIGSAQTNDGVVANLYYIIDEAKFDQSFALKNDSYFLGTIGVPLVGLDANITDDDNMQDFINKLNETIIIDQLPSYKLSLGVTFGNYTFPIDEIQMSANVDYVDTCMIDQDGIITNIEFENNQIESETSTLAHSTLTLKPTRYFNDLHKAAEQKEVHLLCEVILKNTVHKTLKIKL